MKPAISRPARRATPRPAARGPASRPTKTAQKPTSTVSKSKPTTPADKKPTSAKEAKDSTSLSKEAKKSEEVRPSVAQLTQSLQQDLGKTEATDKTDSVKAADGAKKPDQAKIAKELSVRKQAAQTTGAQLRDVQAKIDDLREKDAEFIKRQRKTKGDNFTNEDEQKYLKSAEAHRKNLVDQENELSKKQAENLRKVQEYVEKHGDVKAPVDQNALDGVNPQVKPNEASTAEQITREYETLATSSQSKEALDFYGRVLDTNEGKPSKLSELINKDPNALKSYKRGLEDAFKTEFAAEAGRTSAEESLKKQSERLSSFGDRAKELLDLSGPGEKVHNVGQITEGLAREFKNNRGALGQIIKDPQRLGKIIKQNKLDKATPFVKSLAASSALLSGDTLSRLQGGADLGEQFFDSVSKIKGVPGKKTLEVLSKYSGRVGGALGFVGGTVGLKDRLRRVKQIGGLPNWLKLGGTVSNTIGSGLAATPGAPFAPLFLGAGAALELGGGALEGIDDSVRINQILRGAGIPPKKQEPLLFPDFNNSLSLA